MNGGNNTSLFFLGLPDLKKLVSVTLRLQDDEEPRSQQLKTCRELVLLYSDILACPALDSFTEITTVMAVEFHQRGFLQAFAQRNNLQLGPPRSVFPGDLQCCLSYSLVARLAPRWNKAGPYLVAGRDFLTDRGRLSAISLELSTSEGRLSLSVEASTLRLPAATLEDFELGPLVLGRFCSDPDSVLDPSSTGGAIWCHVLPSMKKGQLVSISRQLPRNGPFRTYVDLQNHWHRLYGYRLPDLAEDQVVYCSVYFRPVGERLFTYPLSCIRLQPIQRWPRVHLQAALGSFLSDVRDRLQSLCGFPTRLSSKPSYHTVQLNTAATVQVMNGEQINLTSSMSIRPVLTQLPLLPLSQPVSCSSGFQRSTWTPLSQQKGALGFNENTFVSPSQTGWALPSSSSSSSSSSPFYPVFQPASSLSVLLPSPPPSLDPVKPPPIVPIFGNKQPSRHINIALLRVQKQEQQNQRVTLPSFGRKTPITPSSSSSSLPPLPPPIIPNFSCPPKPLRRSSTLPQPSDQPRINLLSSLSPVSKVRPGIIVPPKLGIRPKKPRSIMKDPKGTATEQTPLMAADVSNKTINTKKNVLFEKDKSPRKSKKSRAVVEDVEKMARTNQHNNSGELFQTLLIPTSLRSINVSAAGLTPAELSKLSSATLLLWLHQRGVPVGAKLRKEELLMKVVDTLTC